MLLLNSVSTATHKNRVILQITINSTIPKILCFYIKLLQNI